MSMGQVERVAFWSTELGNTSLVGNASRCSAGELCGGSAR
jgi:hypothetical protein